MKLSFEKFYLLPVFWAENFESLELLDSGAPILEVEHQSKRHPSGNCVFWIGRDEIPKTLHGEIGPSRIMCSPTGEVRLTGVGIPATRFAPGDLIGMEPAKFPYDQFAPPELRRSRVPTPLSDQFSLGAILWVLLMGKRFDAKTAASEIAFRESGVPPAVGQVIARMVQPDPANRFPATDDLLDALGALRHAGPE